MTMKERLARYKKGEAGPEERELIESELERFEALGDYLSDWLDCGLAEKMNREESGLQGVPDAAGTADRGEEERALREEEKALTKAIRKAVNRKLLRLAFYVTGILAAAALAAVFAVSPLLDGMYYDPTPPADEWSQQGLVDFACYAELLLPYTDILSLEAEAKGFGVYDIAVNKSVYSSQTRTFFAEIRRGRLTGMDMAFFRGATAGNAFVYSDPFNPAEWIRDNGQAGILRGMPEMTEVKANISFPQGDLPVDQVLELIRKYPEVTFRWIGVRSASRDRQVYPLIGFSLGRSGSVIENYPDEALYPKLNSLPWDKGELTAGDLSLHYKSLLAYLRDREQFMEIFDGASAPDLREALDYAEENGLWSFGCTVAGKSREVARLAEDPLVTGISVEEACFAFY